MNALGHESNIAEFQRDNSFKLLLTGDRDRDDDGNIKRDCLQPSWMHATISKTVEFPLEEEEGETSPSAEIPPTLKVDWFEFKNDPPKPILEMFNSTWFILDSSLSRGRNVTILRKQRYKKGSATSETLNKELTMWNQLHEKTTKDSRGPACMFPLPRGHFEQNHAYTIDWTFYRLPGLSPVTYVTMTEFLKDPVSFLPPGMPRPFAFHLLHDMAREIFTGLYFLHNSRIFYGRFTPDCIFIALINGVVPMVDYTEIQDNYSSMIQDGVAEKYPEWGQQQFRLSAECIEAPIPLRRSILERGGVQIINFTKDFSLFEALVDLGTATAPPTRFRAESIQHLPKIQECFLTECEYSCPEWLYFVQEYLNFLSALPPDEIRRVSESVHLKTPPQDHADVTVIESWLANRLANHQMWKELGQVEWMKSLLKRTVDQMKERAPKVPGKYAFSLLSQTLLWQARVKNDLHFIGLMFWKMFHRDIPLPVPEARYSAVFEIPSEHTTRGPRQPSQGDGHDWIMSMFEDEEEEDRAHFPEFQFQFNTMIEQKLRLSQGWLDVQRQVWVPEEHQQRAVEGDTNRANDPDILRISPSSQYYIPAPNSFLNLYPSDLKSLRQLHASRLQVERDLDEHDGPNFWGTPCPGPLALRQHVEHLLNMNLDRFVTELGDFTTALGYVGLADSLRTSLMEESKSVAFERLRLWFEQPENLAVRESNLIKNRFPEVAEMISWETACDKGDFQELREAIRKRIIQKRTTQFSLAKTMETAEKMWGFIAKQLAYCFCYNTHMDREAQRGSQCQAPQSETKPLDPLGDGCKLECVTNEGTLS